MVVAGLWWLWGCGGWVVVVVCGWDGGETVVKRTSRGPFQKRSISTVGDRFLKTVGSLPNTRLTGATVDRFETVGNGRFLRKPFFASASQARP